MSYHTCPVCGEEKAIRLDGRTEWDTNVGPEMIIENGSCACELDDAQEQDLYERALEAASEPIEPD